MYLCVGVSGHVFVCRGIDFVSFYDLSIIFGIIPDSVVIFS
jgi:hypothetical protein